MQLEEEENAKIVVLDLRRSNISPLIVVKKDGTREQFLREKILNGLVRSCEKRPVRYQQL